MYGTGGPAASALLEAAARLRSESARKRQSRDEARVKKGWSADKDAAKRGSFLNDLTFAADPVGAVAASSRGGDPAEGLETKIAAAALSEEGVWAAAARAWPTVAVPRRARLSAASPLSAGKPPSSGEGQGRGEYSAAPERAVSAGTRALRESASRDVAGVLLGRPAPRDPSGPAESPEGARLAAAVACSVLGVGLVVTCDDGAPLPVVLLPELARVVWITPDESKAPEVVAAREALRRVRDWAAGADSSWTAVGIRRALVAAGLPGPHPRTKQGMLESLRAALGGPRFSAGP